MLPRCYSILRIFRSHDKALVATHVMQGYYKFGGSARDEDSNISTSGLFEQVLHGGEVACMRFVHSTCVFMFEPMSASEPRVGVSEQEKSAVQVANHVKLPIMSGCQSCPLVTRTLHLELLVNHRMFGPISVLQYTYQSCCRFLPESGWGVCPSFVSCSMAPVFWSRCVASLSRDNRTVRWRTGNSSGVVDIN